MDHLDFMKLASSSAASVSACCRYGGFLPP